MAASFWELVAAHAPPDRGRTLLETADGRRVSWAAFEEIVARLAAVLAARGAVPGERVAFQVEKSPEALFLYFACLRAGLVALPLNPAYREGELGPMLADAEPALVVADPARAAGLDTIARRAGARAVLTLDGAGRGSLADEAAAADPGTPPAALDPDAPASMLFTSGTTGRPKGVPLTHANLMSNALVLKDAWGFTAADTLLHALPLYHTHGLFVACHVAVLAQAPMLWLAKYDVAEVLRLLPRATAMMGVPTFYTRLLDRDDFGRAAAAHMRLFVSGSAPLAAEAWRAFEARTGHRILERYGMSEILMHTSNPLDGERRPGSVGPVLPGSSVRIVDDADRDLPADAVGHVLARGPNVFAGYWRRPDLNRGEFLDGGWFRTGDLGSLGADGYLTLAGRHKDLVITGGLNVYPPEVEAVLDAQVGVAEAAVIGLPHRDLGEAVTAVVVAERGASPDAAGLVAACRAALAGYKVPKQVVLVDALPRNAMGKVQKNALRDAHARLYDPG